MDRELREWELALQREPENDALRARFLRACARIEDPALVEGLELLARFLECLAAVAFSRPEVIERPPEEGPRGALWFVEQRPADERGGAEDLAFELVGERLGRPDRRAPRPYAHAVARPEQESLSLWEIFEDSLPSLARLVLSRDLRSAGLLEVVGELLRDIGELIYICFEGADYAWSFRIDEAPEAIEASGAGVVEAVPRVFPEVNGSSSGWAGQAPADGSRDGPLSPFLRAVFQRVLGPGWTMHATDRRAEVRATFYQYSLLRGRDGSCGFEIHSD